MADTALTVIEAAARHLGKLESGGSLTSDEANDGLRVLNGMLETWANDGLPIHGTTLTSHTLVASTGSYTIGAAGADITATRPIRILEAFIRDSSGFDRKLRVLPIEEYDRLVDKDTESSYPRRLYYDPTWDDGTIYLWPVPDTAYTLFVRYENQLGPFSATTTSFSLPPGYQEAIEFNLAVRLAPQYQVEVPEITYQIAEESLAAIKSVNQAGRVPRLRSDAPRLRGARGLSGRYGAYDVESDSYGGY